MRFMVAASLVNWPILGVICLRPAAHTDFIALSPFTVAIGLLFSFCNARISFRKFDLELEGGTHFQQFTALLPILSSGR